MMRRFHAWLTGFLLGCPKLLWADVTQWNSQTLPADFICDAPRPTFQFQMSEDWRLDNAFLMLTAAALAESRDQVTIASQVKDWGFQAVEFIGRPKFGAFAYFAGGADLNLLSFRGTNSFREALSNSFFLPSPFDPIGFAGAGHRGMMHHYKDLLRETETILRRHDPLKQKPLYITGHSLGGAMALFHALHFAKEGWNVVAVYTSAQPHVGDAAFHEDVERWLPGRYFRMEQADDPTPRVPPLAATREVFADLVPLLAGPLNHLVGQMNYSGSRSAPLEIGAQLRWQEGDPDERDVAFWKRLKSNLKNPRSLPALVQSLQERMQEHPPYHYMCSFLRALQNGVETP